MHTVLQEQGLPARTCCHAKGAEPRWAHQAFGSEVRLVVSVTLLDIAKYSLQTKMISGKKILKLPTPSRDAQRDQRGQRCPRSPTIQPRCSGAEQEPEHGCCNAGLLCESLCTGAVISSFAD